MPVLGHAFVGLAIGLCTRPAEGSAPSSGARTIGPALWLPLMVGVSYLPDVAAQILAFTRWGAARAASHSLLFAVLAAAAIAPPVARLAGVPRSRLFAITLASVLLHDVLDLAQATDRLPFWPFSTRVVTLSRFHLPSDPRKEAALFSGTFMVFLAGRQILQRFRRGSRMRLPAPPPRVAWLGHSAVAGIMVVALITHYLRDVRERQLEQAHVLVARRAYFETLATLAQAERWPSTAKPGRIDYLRAEAYAGLGDRARAEVLYLRSYHADPTYFWAVADLAIFYAAAPLPPDDRCRLVAPYLMQLQRDFHDHPHLAAAVARIERRLNSASGANRESPDP